VAYLTLKGRNRKASSIANGAYIEKRFAFGNCKAFDAGEPAAIARVEALLFRLSLFRGGDVEVELCDPVFVDPERVRLNG